MAKSVSGFHTTIALLIAFLLVASLAIPKAEGKAAICPVNKKLVSKRSITWTGVCIKTKNCDKQCKNRETAKHGACHATYKKVWGVKIPTGFACFCYFCKKR